MRVQFPLTSFIGYLTRRSPRTSSRTEAPFEQWEPRLIGLSQLGSWPIHTPFCTSAVTVQPTEQWVQMFLRVSTGAPGLGGGPASALRTLPSGRAPTVASPPAMRPERGRKLRRSSAPPDWPANAAASVPRRASRSVRLISTAASLLGRILVDAVIGLDVIAQPIARLLLVLFGLSRLRAARKGHRGRADARRHGAQEIAPGDGRLGLRAWHGAVPPKVCLFATQDGSAKASVSMSMKVAPTAATAR